MMHNLTTPQPSVVASCENKIGRDLLEEVNDVTLAFVNQSKTN